MGLALFLLLLCVPIGVLLTVSPAWVLREGDGERLALPRGPTPSTEEPGGAAGSSHHPATCLAIAAHRAGAYLGFISARWHLEDLDPMTWLIAGRLRDRFETALLAAIGAVHDWMAQSQHPEHDPRMPVERERLHATLAQLIGSLPAFSVSLGWECHYRVEVLQRIQAQLQALGAGVERHRQAALHPPLTPFR